VSQALVAAGRTIPSGFTVHSLHSYFLRPGNDNYPIVYQVDRTRDGVGFCSRRVRAAQKGKAIFLLSVSFHRPVKGLVHQDPMPSAPDPLSIPSEKEHYKKIAEDPRVIDEKKRKSFMERARTPFPVDIRPVEFHDPFLPPVKKPARKLTWLRVKGSLGDDPLIHQCAMAYLSDLNLISTALLPHGVRAVANPRVNFASLDHSLWFHQPFRADDWLLHETFSPCASNSLGLIMGKVFTRDGTLVVSVAQEALIRFHDFPFTDMEQNPTKESQQETSKKKSVIQAKL